MIVPQHEEFSSLDSYETMMEEKQTITMIPDLVHSDSDCINKSDKYVNRIDDDDDDSDVDSADDSHDNSYNDDDDSHNCTMDHESNNEVLVRQSSSKMIKKAQHEEEECDACPCCEDICGSVCCQSCGASSRMINTNSSTTRVNLVGSNPSTTPSTFPFRRRKNDRIQPEFFRSPLSSPSSSNSNTTRYYTMCEIKRHNTLESMWLVAGKKVYDVTDYIKYHPGGTNCFISKAGGAKDVTRDLNFHSKNGQKLWQKYHIGYVKECSSVLTPTSQLGLVNSNKDEQLVQSRDGSNSNKTWCFIPRFWEMR